MPAYGFVRFVLFAFDEDDDAVVHAGTSRKVTAEKASIVQLIFDVDVMGYVLLLEAATCDFE